MSSSPFRRAGRWAAVGRQVAAGGAAAQATGLSLRQGGNTVDGRAGRCTRQVTSLQRQHGHAS